MSDTKKDPVFPHPSDCGDYPDAHSASFWAAAAIFEVLAQIRDELRNIDMSLRANGGPR